MYKGDGCMEEVNIKYIHWNDGNEEIMQGVQKAMVQYGYGYTRVIYLEEDAGYGYMLIADEYVKPNDALFDLMYQHFVGDTHTPTIEHGGKRYLLHD